MLGFKSILDKKTIMTLRQSLSMKDGEIDIAYNDFLREFEGQGEELEFLIYCSEKKRLKKPKMPTGWQPKNIKVIGIPEEITKKDYLPLFLKNHENSFVSPDINNMYIQYCLNLWYVDCRNERASNKSTMMWVGWEPKKNTINYLKNYIADEKAIEIFIAEFSLFWKESKLFKKDWDEALIEWFGTKKYKQC